MPCIIKAPIPIAFKSKKVAKLIIEFHLFGLFSYNHSWHHIFISHIINTVYALYIPLKSCYCRQGGLNFNYLKAFSRAKKSFCLQAQLVRKAEKLFPSNNHQPMTDKSCCINIPAHWSFSEIMLKTVFYTDLQSSPGRVSSHSSNWLDK